MSRITTHPKVSTFPEPATGDFAFSEASWQEAERELAKYPPDHKASAVMPLLWIAQRQNGGYLTREAIEYVAKVLEMAPIRVHEVAHFYTMYNHAHPGRYQLQICRTTPCMLRGADAVIAKVREKLGVDEGEVTEDGMFSYMEVECLGACCNAPMMQVNNETYYEDLTPENVAQLIDDLAAGKTPQAGSQQGRQGSSPDGDWTTLTTVGEAGAADGPYAAGGEFVPAEVQKARAAAQQQDGQQTGQSGSKNGGS
jgi:NADH-quinone oxidoreductase subunit E